MQVQSQKAAVLSEDEMQAGEQVPGKSNMFRKGKKILNKCYERLR